MSQEERGCILGFQESAFLTFRASKANGYEPDDDESNDGNDVPASASSAGGSSMHAGSASRRSGDAGYAPTCSSCRNGQAKEATCNLEIWDRRSDSLQFRHIMLGLLMPRMGGMAFSPATNPLAEARLVHPVRPFWAILVRQFWAILEPFGAILGKPRHSTCSLLNSREAE